MREAVGNLWDYQRAGAVLAISTNGVVTSAGRCVMGRGCAKEARDRFPDFDYQLGTAIRRYGNRCFRFSMDVTESHESEWTLCTFVVKHHWRQQADFTLIEQSAEQLVEMADKFGWQEIVTIRPGCGNGGLRWEDVQPLLAEIFDDRFLIVHNN